jgi:hypothetical protein
MKKIFIILFLYLPVIAFTQERILLKGNIFDGITFFPIDGANIYNFSSKKYSFTNKEGNFEISAKLGDTIVISKPVYKQVLIEVTQNILENNMLEVAIFYKAIILKEVNVYSLPATYSAFKREFVSVDLSDFYKRLGGTGLSDYERSQYSQSHGLLDMIPGKVGQAVTHPISFLYDTFSRKAKMNRLYQEMLANQEEIDKFPSKYNRDLVTSLTGLEGEELLDFMTFCKFSYYDLVRWSPEFIVSQIQKKFGDYEFYKALEDN